MQVDSAGTFQAFAFFILEILGVRPDPVPSTVVHNVLFPGTTLSYSLFFCPVNKFYFKTTSSAIISFAFPPVTGLSLHLGSHCTK